MQFLLYRPLQRINTQSHTLSCHLVFVTLKVELALARTDLVTQDSPHIAIDRVLQDPERRLVGLHVLALRAGEQVSD